MVNGINSNRFPVTVAEVPQPVDTIDTLFERFTDEAFAKKTLSEIDLEKDHSFLVQKLVHFHEGLTLYFCKRVDKASPDWWNKEGVKEYALSSALQNGFVSLSSYLIPRIDCANVPSYVSFEYVGLEGLRKTDVYIEPLALAALTGHKAHGNLERIIKHLFDLGVDFAATKQWQNGASASAFEIAEECFREDLLFISRLIEKSPIEWLKAYFKLLNSIRKQDGVQAALEIKNEFSQEQPAQWARDSSRLEYIFELAIQYKEKEVAALLVDRLCSEKVTKVFSFKPFFIKALDNGWDDLVQILVTRCCLQVEEIPLLVKNSKISTIAAKYASLNTCMVLDLLVKMSLRLQKKQFIELATRLLELQPQPLWMTYYHKRLIYNSAIECDALDIAFRVIAKVEETESSFFIASRDSRYGVGNIDVFDKAIHRKWKEGVSALLRLPSSFGSIIDKLETTFSEKELEEIYRNAILDERHSLQLFYDLAKRKKRVYATIILDRLTKESPQLPVWAKTAAFQASLLFILLMLSNYKEQVTPLISAAILALLIEIDGRNTTVYLEIEKRYGSAFAVELLNNVDVSNYEETLNLLNIFDVLGKKEASHVLFNKLLTQKTAPQWMKDPDKYTRLFCIVVSCNEIEFAHSMADTIDLKGRLPQTKCTPLMHVAAQPQSVSMKALLIKLLARGASLVDTNVDGIAAFVYVYTHYPDLATQYVETCPLEHDLSSLFELLIRERLYDLAMTLFGRLQSVSSPIAWWTGKARAQLFFMIADHIKNSNRAKEMVDLLIADENLDVCTVDDNGHNVLWIALVNDLEQPAIDELIELGGRKALLQCDSYGTSTFEVVCLYHGNRMCTQNTVLQFLESIGCTQAINSSYNFIKMMMEQTIQQNTANSFLRVIYATLLHKKEWLQQYLYFASFSERYRFISTTTQKLSKSFEDMLLDCAFCIDTRHFSNSVLPKKMPLPSAPIAIDALKELYTRYGGRETSAEKIDLFIERIKQKKKDVATPSDMRAVDAFYKTIEDQILLVLDYFRTEIATAEKEAGKQLVDAAPTHARSIEILKSFRAYCADCATVTEYCGTRLQDHARSYYVQYILKQKYDFISQIRCELAEYRTTIAQTTLTYDSQSVHAYNAFLHKYGKIFGIPESECDLEDKFMGQHGEQVEIAGNYFVQTYTPSNIIHFVSFVLQDNNNRERFFDFLSDHISLERNLFEKSIANGLIQKNARPFVNKQGICVDKSRVQENFAEAPYYITLNDDDVVSIDTISNALKRKENRDRILFAHSEDSKDCRKEYTWVGIALLLIEMNVLK